MKKWQLGISDIQIPDKIHWQDDFVEAETREEAEDLAAEKGYYRNLEIREVQGDPEENYKCVKCFCELEDEEDILLLVCADCRGEGEENDDEDFLDFND